jgi:multiple sugar transport system substrate-binding protein
MAENIGELSRRRLLQLSAVAGAGLLLGACDVGGGEGGTSGNSGTEGSGEGTIKALFMKQAGYSEDDIRAMTDEFQQKNPKIKVEASFVAYEALHDKIVAAAPASTFDVVLIDVIWPAEFGSKRIVSDVTEQFPAEWKSDMLGGALATADYQDHYYGVPWILDTKYFFYNKDMLTRAGVDPASLATWDGVLAAARALKAAKKVVDYPLIWSWKQAEALICDYTQLVGAFGGKFLSDDGKSIEFNTGGGLQALEFMKKTLDTKLTNPNSVESLEEDVRKIFSDGQAAMALNWTYMFNAANDPKQSKIAGKVGVAPTPTGPSGGPGVNGSMALSVSSGSKNQKAAWTYISYITSAEVQNKYAKSSLPCWAKSYDESAVVSALPQVVPVAKKQLADLIARPQVPRYNEISQILQAEVQNALLGRKPTKKALDDAADQARTLLS